MIQIKRLAMRALSCVGLLVAPATLYAESTPAPAPVEAARPAPAKDAPAQAQPKQQNEPAADTKTDPKSEAKSDTEADSKSEPKSETHGAGSSWNAEVAPADGRGGMTLDARQTEVVNKVSDYFKTLTTLKGRFVQTGADNKRMRGMFYVKRPGLFRFDYARPSRQIVISDGRYLAIQDLDLNNEDRVALNDTPFRLLLRSDVNLIRDAHIKEVQESEDLIVVGLEDKDPNTSGQIRLFMVTKPALELKEWVTKDAQGLDTRVEVSELAKAVELDGDLFRIKAMGKPMASP